MTPKKFQPDPSEMQTPTRAQKGEAKPLDMESVFREAVASGEIDGDLVMLDDEGNEAKAGEPRKTIFDL